MRWPSGFQECVHACPADVTDQSSLDAAIMQGLERFGLYQAVVANAGRGHDGDLLGCTGDELHDVLAVNVTGVHRTVRAAAPHLTARGHIVIVLVCRACQCR